MAMQQPPLPPKQPPADSIPYLGSRISLVSKTDVRYEGFLFNIDTRQSIVALQNVRSFGTEGRRADHVPPSPHVLQYATFKAAEIKDLHVCEAAPQPPANPPLPSAPSPPVVAPASPRKPTLLTPGSVSSAHNETPEPTPARRHNSNRSAQSNQARTIPGMGGHLLKRKERRAPGGTEGTNVVPEAASGEFNFEERLHDFDKQQEFVKLEESTKKDSKGSYQKSMFFDTISCDALDRLEGQRSRMSGAEERKLNTETFGAVGLNNRRNLRGRGRGRRGGSRSSHWNGTRANGGSGGGRNYHGSSSQHPSGP